MLFLLGLTSYRWNVNAVPWALVGIALVVLASVIFDRQRISRVALLFCLMILLVAVWFLAFAGMFLAADHEVASLFGRVALAGVCFLPAAIYDFTVTALRLSARRRAVVLAGWIVAMTFALLTLSTTLVMSDVLWHSWGWYPVAGPLLLPFIALFLTALAGQLAEGLRERSLTRDPKRRHSIARLLLAFVVVYFAALDFLPMFGVPAVPIGYLPVIGFMLVAWTSIRRHRFPSLTAARAAHEILDTMADALFVIDADARIRVMNGSVRTLLGYDDSELLGRSIDTLERVDGDATISRTLHDLASRGPIRDQERRFRRKDGESVDVGVSISPISGGDGGEGERAGAVVIARDIRERKHAEVELRSFMTRLEQSNRELEDFAYVASHDLQEPLRKIQAFGDLLKSKHAADLPPQGRDYVDRMQSAARRMQVLINDLLSFSRVTTKAHPFTSTDLTEIAREVAHDLEARVHDAGGSLVIGELPRIDADPTQMRQLLQNLAANALKFHREGVPPKVEIDGKLIGPRVCITVRDNGIGFEPKYAERIFTMFERLHGRGKYEGTGIGLAICRKIAERHGGQISATSTPGEGSVFTIDLPQLHEELHDHQSQTSTEHHEVAGAERDHLEEEAAWSSPENRS